MQQAVIAGVDLFDSDAMAVPVHSKAAVVQYDAHRQNPFKRLEYCSCCDALSC
jgi:hypothetical protein